MSQGFHFEAYSDWLFSGIASGEVHFAAQLSTFRHSTISANPMAILLTIEIGCRGYINNNVLHVLEQLVLSMAECRSTLKSCSKVALHCSYVIYLNRIKSVRHNKPYISRLE